MLPSLRRKDRLPEKSDRGMDKLIALIRLWIEQKKVGKITINFFKGGITNINIEESKKIEDLN